LGRTQETFFSSWRISCAGITCPVTVTQPVLTQPSDNADTMSKWVRRVSWCPPDRSGCSILNSPWSRTRSLPSRVSRRDCSASGARAFSRGAIRFAEALTASAPAGSRGVRRVSGAAMHVSSGESAYPRVSAQTLPQMRSAVAVTSSSFCVCSSSVSVLPSSVEAKPHCGAMPS